MDQRLSVLFVLPSFAGGGAERVLITLLNALDPARYDRHLLLVDGSGPLRSLVDPDISLHILERPKVRFALADIVQAIQGIRPDVVLSTMAHLNFGLLLLRPFLPKATRLIVREAITPSYFIDKDIKSIITQWGYRLLYPYADTVLAPAQTIIDEFRSLVGLTRANFACLFNPVDLARVRGTSPHLLHPNREERGRTVHFIAAGRLDNQKGFDQLIESLPWLGDELAPGIRWQLTILGEGDKRPKIEDFIRRHHLTDRIHLPGFSAAPWPQIGMADVYLLPSRYEGLPNVALESLAVGTPVIALASAGGIQEIARLAAPGAVTIAADMPAMIDAMRHVRPAVIESYGPSLLPDAFTLGDIMPRLERILQTGSLSSDLRPHDAMRGMIRATLHAQAPDRSRV